ncbi:hypothetical protein FWF89_03545 [Candidatus Saccharibacteria bacterium]|nr:hypothetical protein [Candidatus Saccharibacteria bacterium]
MTKTKSWRPPTFRDLFPNYYVLKDFFKRLNEESKHLKNERRQKAHQA